MLETEIKNLATLVKDLNSTMQALTAALQLKDLATEPAVEAAETAPVVETEPTAEAAPTVTHDDIQALCLATVRANRDNKAAIKSILNDVGASNVNGIPDGKLADVYAAISALEV